MTDMITEHVKLPGGVTAVLERPGARLVYEVAGDGPAVVLIHGFGLDMRMWDPQIGPRPGRGHPAGRGGRGAGGPRSLAGPPAVRRRARAARPGRRAGRHGGGLPRAALAGPGPAP